jgi:hypothetical protein
VDEREIERTESSVRRSLSSLDSLAVPSLSAITTRRRASSRWSFIAPLATAAAVLVIALAAGQGLVAFRSERGPNGPAAGSRPGASLSPNDAAAGAATRYLDVDGYRFTVTVIEDARYGPNPSAAAYLSALPGVGLRCEWVRTAADVSKLDDLWGTVDAVASTARYAPVPSGTRGERANGIPAAAVRGSPAATICGVTDGGGSHGVVTYLTIVPGGAYTSRALDLTRWSGIVGDVAAVVPCTGKQGTFPLIAAFVSTASEVADWVENVRYPDLPHAVTPAFRTYPASAPIYVCYFAGRYAPSVGPGGPGQTAEAVEYDRGLFFIDANGVIVPPSKIGTSATIPLIRPGGPF